MMLRLRLQGSLRWVVVVFLTLAGGAGLAAIPSVAGASTSSCKLHGPAGAIKHVIYIQFDNVHLRRDNTNVPSDLQQMPHLLHFIEGKGAMLTHHYTPLVSHTANDILTTLTGLYGDRHGMPIANEYDAYNPDGTTFTAGSFAYWTDPVVSYSSKNSKSSDPLPTFVGPGGKNPPAPWVPYTRAGCTVGSVAAADTELENTTPDIAHVFGPGTAPAKSRSASASTTCPAAAQSSFCQRLGHSSGRRSDRPVGARFDRKSSREAVAPIATSV